MSRNAGHIGLVVLGSIAAGLALGALLVGFVLAGAGEAQTTGAALLALGTGFLLLAAAAARWTSRPQRWALAPGAGAVVAGLLLLVLRPGDGALAAAGWVWPLLLFAAVAWSVAGARRALDNWSRRALLYPAFAVLALVALGGAFETVASATGSDAAPGRTYVIDGHRLYLHCTGTGAPAVVLFNGLGERSTSWSRVQRQVASTTRVCAFDPAGQGWSGAAPTRQDGHQVAFDLHRLLRAAHVRGPYVLAGHSVGGTYALVYAAQYPRDVAGVALIDSATPYQFDLPDYPGFYSLGRRLYAVLPTLARAGIARAVLGGGFASSPRELRADHDEFMELPTVFDEAKRVRSLHGRPLVVLTAGAGAQGGWIPAQKRLALLSRNSRQRTVPTTHSALLDGAAGYTTRAIRDVVRAVARSAADRGA